MIGLHEMDVNAQIDRLCRLPGQLFAIIHTIHLKDIHMWPQQGVPGDLA